MTNDTHSKTMGYLIWIFGFLGAHRFYYLWTLNGQIDELNRRGVS